VVDRNSCAIRNDKSPLVTGDPEIESKILDGIDNQLDFCDPRAGLFFCLDDRNIDRKDMPQLSGNVNDRNSPVGKFTTSLMKSGVKVSDELSEVCKLKATQNELNGNKIRGFLEYLKDAKGDLNDPAVSFITDPIIVSNDDYVLDGHHRWAALLAYDFVDRKDNEIIMNIRRVDLPIDELLNRANCFEGVEHCDFHAPSII